MRRAAVATLVSLALAAQPIAPTTFSVGAAHAQALPDLGEESQAALTAGQERRIGESIVRQIRASGAYLEDPEVNDYLNELGHRLVAALPESRQDFEFFAMADPSVNAFALPGGYVGVNTGLILITQSESELASVLAHEITHVTQRHMARSVTGQQRGFMYMLAALAVAVAASRSNSSSSGQATSAALAAAQALSIQTQINYTREHEYEADRIGFQRLDAGGFDVNAMATLMDRLQKSNRFADGTAPSYLRSHPITYERIAEAQSRAYGKAYRQVTDSQDFHLVRALLRSYAGTSREAVAYFRAALADRKFNDEVAARYGLVASLLRDEAFPQAIAELAALEKDCRAASDDRGDGRTRADGSRQTRSGHRALPSRRSRAIRTSCSWSTIIRRRWPRPGARAKPRPSSNPSSRDSPGNGPLHRIAARIYAELGMKQQEHRHQGEFYAWQGDFRGAVRQFELASKAGDGDFYQASVVEARLRALRKELAEQQAESGKNG